VSAVQASPTFPLLCRIGPLSTVPEPVSTLPEFVSAAPVPVSELVVSEFEKFVFVSSLRLDWFVDGIQARQSPKTRHKRLKFFMFYSDRDR
tara:strand:- start:292 stop:564 length:273 start_codon:yes stop_codon:yes gene_type:complete